MLKISFILFVLFSLQVQAKTLSLEECITKAIQTHPDIKSATLAVKQTKSGIDVAVSDYLPQVSLSAEYDATRTYVLPQNGIFNTINDSGLQAGVTLNQKVWDFSKTTSYIEASKIQEAIAKLSLQDAKALMSYNVKLQYELIYVYKEAIDVRKKDMQAKKELYNQANSLVKLGMKTDADASRFLSSYYIAEDNLAIAQANYDKARLNLSSFIGEKVQGNITLEDTLSTHKISVTNTLLYKSILESNLGVATLLKSVQKDELLYKATKASHYGSLDMVASYNYQDTLNEYDSTLLGITLKIPLYSGGRTSALVQESFLERKKTEALLDAKELALKQEFGSLIIDLARYEKTIQAKNAQLGSAQKTKVLLDARYKEGLSTYIEVLDATFLLLDAKLGLLQEKYSKSSAINRIEYLQGKIL